MTPCVALGRGLVTRVSRESIFSDLNNLEVVTTSSLKYRTSFGFTQAEVDAALAEYGLEGTAGEVRRWYDGYEASDVVPPDPGYSGLKETGRISEAARYALYSPLSVVEATTTGAIRDYWNQTETYEALTDFIRRDYDGLKGAVALLLDGGRLGIR